MIRTTFSIKFNRHKIIKKASTSLKYFFLIKTNTAGSSDKKALIKKSASIKTFSGLGIKCCFGLTVSSYGTRSIFVCGYGEVRKNLIYEVILNSKKNQTCCIFCSKPFH